MGSDEIEGSFRLSTATKNITAKNDVNQHDINPNSSISCVHKILKGKLCIIKILNYKK